MMTDMLPRNLFERAAAIQLVALDVDGVLTDSRIVYGSDAQETKAFNIKDGLGISLGVRSGLKFAIITARESPMVSRRAKELGIAHVIQNMRTKLPALEALMKELQLEESQVAYIGDDLPDLPCLERVGLPACPGDAAREVRNICALVSDYPAGQGAVRQIIEFILDSKAMLTSAS
ncbi:MAG TPA: HAD hydrolase family protein [Oculatellaceae cyanobacterium]|jgi:3-deoxy-D-manno-octulosonate 8-phosphate phosphatase (KDO 8-P phosphatase)